MATAIVRRFWNSSSLFLPHLRSIALSSYKQDIFDIASEDDFQKRVLRSSKPVVVDFHAEWCAPCKVLGPVLTKVVESRQGTVDLAKVDIDQLQELAIAHKVSAVPTVVLVRDGEVVDQFIGGQPEQFLNEFVPIK